MENKSKGKSKKIITVAILYLVGVFFIFAERATFLEGGTFAQWLYGVYALGNVGTKAAVKIQHKNVIDIGLSRKLIGFGILFITSLVFIFIQNSQSVYITNFADGSEFVKGIFFIYIGGNVGDKIALSADKLMKDRPNNQPIQTSEETA